MAARLAGKPEEMLKILAHEELGLSERSFPYEWKSALSDTVSTALGAAIPVLPYLFAKGLCALVTSFAISTAAHFAVGAGQGGGHRAFLAAQRPGDDADRTGRGGDHLRHRTAEGSLPRLSPALRLRNCARRRIQC